MLNQLTKVTTKKARRVGRGYASGKGLTAGKGIKGQKARSGYKAPRPGFEGGQMPLSRRLPKLKGFSREFINAEIKEYVVSLSDLNSFKDGDEVTIESLVESGIVRPTYKKFLVKVLANGKLEKKLSLVGIDVSAGAKQSIEKAGGEVK